MKGYEFRKDQYLLLNDEDFDGVKVESSSVMTIEKFVDTDSIDPVYFDAAYFLAPDGDAGRDVYAVLRQAIGKPEKRHWPEWWLPSVSAQLRCGRWTTGLMAHTLYEHRDMNARKTCSRMSTIIKTDPEMVPLARSRSTGKRGLTAPRTSRTATRPGCAK